MKQIALWYEKATNMNLFLFKPVITFFCKAGFIKVNHNDGDKFERVIKGTEILAE